MSAAVALGAVAGLRSATPLGALAARGRLAAGNGPLRVALVAAAAGEWAGDKHPNVPARTSPPALGGRVAVALFVGHRVGGPSGAAAAATAAVAAAFAGQHTRRLLGAVSGLPDPLLGAAEDLLAAAIALRAAGRLPRQP